MGSIGYPDGNRRMTATVGHALQAAGQALRQAGITGAALEARLLLGEVLGTDAPALIAHPERAVTAVEAGRFQSLVNRRAARQPMAQILGRREFWSLSFRVTADTLDPRPDSEAVVEAGLAEIADPDAPLRLLDLGTGTGCLLLALLSELPRATGLGVDCSEPALEVARANAAALGLGDRAAFRRGHWCDGLSETFDVIVSNPPYIATSEIDGLMPEVAQHEPRLALDGGGDGLAAYRAIAGQVARLVKPQARLVLEVGDGQADSVAAIFAGARLLLTAIRADLAGRARCVVLQWNC